jgi:hypothetical protein
LDGDRQRHFDVDFDRYFQRERDSLPHINSDPNTQRDTDGDFYLDAELHGYGDHHGHCDAFFDGQLDPHGHFVQHLDCDGN